MGTEQQIIGAIIIGLILVLTILSVVIMFVTLHRKRYLSQQYAIERLEVEKRQALLETIITTQEEERNRISKNLHDGVGVDLSMVGLNLSRHVFTEARGEKSDVDVKQQLEVLNQTIENIRNICRDIYPSNFAANGLLRSLDYLYGRLNETGSIHCQHHCTVKEEDLPMSMDMKLSLFRICQEITNNILKHAQCDQIDVHTTLTDQLLQLEFIHNGKAFTDKDAELKKQSGKGIGLISIENRINMLHGNIRYFVEEHLVHVRLQVAATHATVEN